MTRAAASSAARPTVTGYLMCTDNMPSGTAMQLGDVITMRGGKTVEVHQHRRRGPAGDGRRARARRPRSDADAIVDIATLTGACLRALGTAVAGVMGNDAAPRRPGPRPPGERPTRPSGSCRSTGATATSSTPRSPTSRTSAAPTPARSPRRCSSRSSSATSRGRTSTSPARRRRRPTTLGVPKGATGFGARLLVDFALNFDGSP